MEKLLSRKLALVSLISLVIGIGATVGVFAAIPHSTTKVISACRNNVSGALRVIDLQSGAQCNFLEKGLSWNGDLETPSAGAKTAVFRQIPDTSDSDFPYAYSPQYSRGILSHKKLVANDPVNNPTDNRGYCIELDFTVAFTTSNGGSNTEGLVFYPASLDGSGLSIDTACGPGYDALISPGVIGTEIFLSE